MNPLIPTKPVSVSIVIASFNMINRQVSIDKSTFTPRNQCSTTASLVKTNSGLFSCSPFCPFSLDRSFSCHC